MRPVLFSFAGRPIHKSSRRSFRTISSPPATNVAFVFSRVHLEPDPTGFRTCWMHVLVRSLVTSASSWPWIHSPSVWMRTLATFSTLAFHLVYTASNPHIFEIPTLRTCYRERVSSTLSAGFQRSFNVATFTLRPDSLVSRGSASNATSESTSSYHFRSPPAPSSLVRGFIASFNST